MNEQHLRRVLGDYVAYYHQDRVSRLTGKGHARRRAVALKPTEPAMLRQGPLVAWIVDDTGFPKKGRHSVGVTRQYCGQAGKQENCRVAVSASVTTDTSSMPVSFQLYLPDVWAGDKQRRRKAGVPEEVVFRTKPRLALQQIRRARERGIPEAVILAGAGLWNGHQVPRGTNRDEPAVRGGHHE